MGKGQTENQRKPRPAMYFFRTYLCVWLPVLLISLFLSEHMIGTLGRQEDSIVALQVAGVADSLNGLYASYATSSPLLASTDELLARRMLMSYAGARVGIKRIRDFDVYDPVVSDIFMYYGDEYVYSSNGYSKAYTHFSKVLGCDGESTARALALLSGGESGCRLLWREDGRGYLFLLFTDIVGVERRTAVGYMIPYAQLAQTVRAMFDTQPLAMDLSFGAGDGLRFALSADGQVGVGRLSEAAYENSTEVRREVEALGATLRVHYRSEYLYETVRWNQALNNLLLVAGMIISVLASLLLSHKSQVKIDRLEAILDGRPEEDLKARDEYALIRAKIRHTLREASESQESERNTRRNLRSQTARLLFHGLFRDRAEAEKIMELGEVELYEESFFLCGVCFQGAAEARLAFEAEFERELSCEESVRGQGVRLILFELPNDDVSGKLQGEIIERVTRELTEGGARGILIAASRVYQDASMAGFACQEVVSLLEHMEPGDATRVRRWDNMAQASDGLVRIRRQDIDGLLTAIVARDEAGALNMLRQLNRCIESEGNSEENRRYLRYCVLHPLIVLIQTSLADPDGEFLRAAEEVDPSDGEEFEARLTAAIAGYMAGFANQNDFQRILHYLQEHYADCNLTAEQVAEFAGVNKTYLSRLFRTRTGMSYIDYLTDVRMRAAKDLLAQTDLPLRDIVARVGYIDASSFRRKFKTLFEQSAQDYRAQNRPDSPQ